MIKVEPDLPEPATEPTAFLAGSTDHFFVERWLASGGVKVDDAEDARLGREDIVDAIEQCIKVWDLETTLGRWDDGEEEKERTMERE